MPDPARQRAFALEIAKKLRAAGFESLWAGGCVRDELLGLLPKDYDVATSATPEKIRELFGRRRTLAIGAAFGVVTVLGPRAAGQIEVATFRTDAAYSDGRHPDSVHFTTAEHDAQRRDFTINGLFYDPIAEQVVDYVSGQEDLRRRIIRAIGDPRLRLGEDKLRMLRAVRFAATFGFEIELETFRAIQEMAADIKTVSAERIGMEVRRMLLDPNRAAALELLRETNLLSHILPEVAYVSIDTFAEIKRILSALNEPTISLALAALLCAETDVPTESELIGPPPADFPNMQIVVGTRSYSFVRGCWRLAPENAQRVARRLRFTNKEGERAAWLLAKRFIIADAPALPWPLLQRLLTHEGVAELIALHEAIAGPSDAALVYCRERLAWPPERLNPSPLLNGSDLMQHGLEPGPDFARFLEQVRDAQLNGEIRSREDALALVDRLRDRGETLP
jgi:poly(A) polymerase